MLVTLDFSLELRGSEIFISQVDKETLSSGGAICFFCSLNGAVLIGGKSKAMNIPALTPMRSATIESPA
jgi:hypothetical protein